MRCDKDQIDNWDELGMIEEITATMDHPVNVGIRIWMDTGLTPAWSKFGFSFASGEAARAALRVVANPHLTLHTLHSHIGTYVLEPKAYAVAAERLVAFRSMLFGRTGHLVPCLNLGGGFPSTGLMHEMPENTKVPPIEDYAAAIAGVLNELPRKQRPQLRLETGRHLIDDAGYLITSVVAHPRPCGPLGQWLQVRFLGVPVVSSRRPRCSPRWTRSLTQLIMSGRECG